ncbi:MAG: GNAT family N-acetyltransferase [Alphaproteobacteria bacterium]|nr:GNAT family N-acetyltransferase [Alphaproteobacteria bacterium]HPF45348.1 GNAT family N-acetyltransferase [Emcibacteraceae bacterium]HRW29549.1 GNAT family N-acetyltransferase [Emcibacteraceae bacterium]
MISTRLVNDDDLTHTTIKRITDLINQVYAVAEADLWKAGLATRTNREEIENFIRDKALIIAEKDGYIVGVCKVSIESNETGEFGMLAADPARRGIGIGRELVNAAENWARHLGFKTMRLELLTPRHWKNDSKEFLKIWYDRLGYKPSYTLPFEELFAHRINDFATDCDFTVWLKEL